MEKKIHKSSIVDKIIYAIIDMIDQRVLSPEINWTVNGNLRRS